MDRNARRLAGVVCVVTGAARGIGLAIVERLAAEGGRVAAWDVRARRLDPAVAELRGRGLEVRGLPCDVGSRAAVAEAMAAARSSTCARCRHAIRRSMRSSTRR